MSDYCTDLAAHGFAVIPDLLDLDELESLALAIAQVGEESCGRNRGVYAIRNLLQAVPSVANLATCPGILNLAQHLLGSVAAPVKATLFDKTPDANWLVPWHQDLTISVKERVDIDGFGPWTVKAGVLSVQPPVSILERMLAIRIHLDDCEEGNGPLRVLPGTHRFGRLNADKITSLRAEIDPVSCAVRRGGVLLMKPLLLHASSASVSPSHRRVIHIDYAAVGLPLGLLWSQSLLKG